MKKTSQKSFEVWKKIPHKINSPEDSFFAGNQEIINNIKRRIFGIQHKEELASLENLNPKRRKEEITKILHNTKNIANRLAYSAHNGRHWERDNLDKMQWWLLNQLFSGRSLEILLAEAFIRLGGGYHFVPAKELDTEYKIDFISRLPVQEANAVRSIAFGTQITMANLQDEKKIQNPQNPPSKKKITRHGKTFYTPKIPETPNKNRYQEKFDQIQSLVPFLHALQTQREISEKYGQLSVPDIISYTTINGKIRDTLGNESNPTMKYFREWRKNNFTKDGLLDFFKKDFREMLMTIAKTILETQQYILSKNFFEKSQKNFKWNVDFGENKEYKKIINFSMHEKRLTLILKHQGEILMKTTFFLTESDFEKIGNLHHQDEK